MILAAGRGTRMGSVTEELPKPMLPIHGRPMLEHILDRLMATGIERFLVVVGYRGALVEQHFADLRPELEERIQFVWQQPVDGTGSATLLASHFAAGRPFLLTFGDILVDPAEYLRCQEILSGPDQPAAVVAVKEVDDPWQGAAVYEEQGRILRIIEKPPKGSSTTHWNSAGFFGFRPVIFDYLSRVKLSARGEYELTSAVDAMLADGLDLRIAAVAGAWRDVGRPEDLAAENL